MGLVAVMIWTTWFGGALPRWVWPCIAADLIFSIPRTIDFYMKFF